MSPDNDRPRAEDPNRFLYWTIGIGLVALCIIGLITYSGKKETQEAVDKAAQLSQKLDAAGLRVPDADILVRSFGTDGGAVCDNPASALGKATLFAQLTNGASHVGQRPVIVDRRALTGELLVLETYCPDKLEEYRDEIGDLKVDDVIKD